MHGLADEAWIGGEFISPECVAEDDGWEIGCVWCDGDWQLEELKEICAGVSDVYFGLAVQRVYRWFVIDLVEGERSEELLPPRLPEKKLLAGDGGCGVFAGAGALNEQDAGWYVIAELIEL